MVAQGVGRAAWGGVGWGAGCVFGAPARLEGGGRGGGRPMVDVRVGAMEGTGLKLRLGDLQCVFSGQRAGGGARAV